MFFLHWICLTLVTIPAVHLARPSVKLTFDPDEKYIARDAKIEIKCELLNPTENTESAQLWYIDIKTGKRTPISRLLLTSPMDDAPEVFKSNKNKRYEYLRKNHIVIRRLQMEDSGKYECNCPDCEETIGKQVRDLFVMKLAEPRWAIEPGWPIHENAKTTIKCLVDDFYPYVGHKILHNHHEITNNGKSSLPSSQPFPQKFIWEGTITPTADWHNTTLRCEVTQGQCMSPVECRHASSSSLGNSMQQTTKTLDVLFAPRFIQCEERQHVDTAKDQATIECSYSGNPAPTLTWRRQTDQRAINADAGVTIETKDEHHGKYRSIVKFDRAKLLAFASTSPTTAAPGQAETSAVNYYQALVNGGFVVQLTVNGNDRGTRVIQIVRNANQIRVNPSDSSASISLSSMLVGLLSVLHMLRC